MGWYLLYLPASIPVQLCAIHDLFNVFGIVLGIDFDSGYCGAYKRGNLKRHTKIYMDAFGYDVSDFIPSEISGQKAIDINHIDSRGMGGDPTGSKDVIENLMALTREEHIEYGDKVQYFEWLKKIHYTFMEKHGLKVAFK